MQFKVLKIYTSAVPEVFTTTTFIKYDRLGAGTFTKDLT